MNWKHVAWFQGVYYLVSGAWPIVHMNSFLRVTGPKTDLWLVRLVGLLICVCAAALLHAAARSSVLSAHAAIVAIGFAAMLLSVDVYYVARGVIDPIYLGDAVIEVGLLIAWSVALARRQAASPS